MHQTSRIVLASCLLLLEMHLAACSKTPIDFDRPLPRDSEVRDSGMEPTDAGPPLGLPTVYLPKIVQLDHPVALDLEGEVRDFVVVGPNRIVLVSEIIEGLLLHEMSVDDQGDLELLGETRIEGLDLGGVEAFDYDLGPEEHIVLVLVGYTQGTLRSFIHLFEAAPDGLRRMRSETLTCPAFGCEQNVEGTCESPVPDLEFCQIHLRRGYPARIRTADLNQDGFADFMINVESDWPFYTWYSKPAIHSLSPLDLGPFAPSCKCTGYGAPARDFALIELDETEGYGAPDFMLSTRTGLFVNMAYDLNPYREPCDRSIEPANVCGMDASSMCSNACGSDPGAQRCITRCSDDGPLCQDGLAQRPRFGCFSESAALPLSSVGDLIPIDFDGDGQASVVALEAASPVPGNAPVSTLHIFDPGDKGPERFPDRQVEIPSAGNPRYTPLRGLAVRTGLGPRESLALVTSEQAWVLPQPDAAIVPIWEAPGTCNEWPHRLEAQDPNRDEIDDILFLCTAPDQQLVRLRGIIPK